MKNYKSLSRSTSRELSSNTKDEFNRTLTDAFPARLSFSLAEFSESRDVGANATLHCKRKNLTRCSPARIPVQTEIDIAEWEE
jgi:hypothetical protein